MPEFKIIKNSVQCLHCKVEIESVDRHDFRSCECGNVSVDGGKDYLRRLFKDSGSFRETSITEGGDDAA